MYTINGIPAGQPATYMGRRVVMEPIRVPTIADAETLPYRDTAGFHLIPVDELKIEPIAEDTVIESTDGSLRRHIVDEMAQEVAEAPVVRVCSEDGCERPAKTKGRCGRCYQRARRQA